MSKNTINDAASCMDDYDPNSLSPDDAVTRITSSLQAVSGFEKIAIRSALERILASDVYSSINVPGHTNSAMDGYAVRSSDLPIEATHDLRLIGTSWAGKPFTQPTAKGECVRIMTGAAMPPGTDTVVMQEHVEIDGDMIRIDDRNRKGQNVRQAGEDIGKGACVLKTGKRLRPADIGLLASLGIGEALVKRRLRVAFFSTGDELRSIGEPLETGMIYDSNRYTLHAMLTRLGVEIIDMGVIRDDRDSLIDAFTQASSDADVVITSGGVSVGDADYVKETLEKLGEINFWKVAMKPGRPLAFGRLQDAVFFGLPGNPVSVMATFYLFVQPALRRLMGEAPRPYLNLKVPATNKLKKRPGRTEYQRAVLSVDSNGEHSVSTTGAQGSGILRSMSEANCFIVLPMESMGAEPGDLVEVIPFEAFV